MISEIRICGLGVIDEAVLRFSPGLTVLTGETGAGKTMVLTSLRLLLGDKGDASLVREGHQQIEVDGIFEPTEILSKKLSELGVNYEDDELIVSRTVPRSGRSRATIDGRPVPIRLLGETIGDVVTIHGQADQWRVRKAQVQRQMLDEFAGANHLKLVEEYQEAWKEAVAAKRHLDELRQGFDQSQIELHYLQEITQSIMSMSPEEGEEESLDKEIDRLTNAAELRRDVAGVASALGSESLISDSLGQALSLLRKAVAFDTDLEQYLTRLETVSMDAESLGEELTGYVDGLRDDPLFLDELVQRRKDLEDLMRGRATTVAELLAWNQDALERLAELGSEDADPDAATAQLEAAQEKVVAVGEKLRTSRQKAARKLQKIVNNELSDLAMPNATFRINVVDAKPSASGSDEVSMELRSHSDAPYKAIGEGASGGELSRVMLALEVALGQRAAGGTYIFDEVDAGIGGTTAIEVGKRLARLARTQQVVVVTHLPQVAAFADAHLVVEKKGGKTTVASVVDDLRVEEIVRMLGSESDSVAARRHALELLDRNSWQNHGSGS